MPLIDCLIKAADIIDSKVKDKMLRQHADIIANGMDERQAGQQVINDFAKEYANQLNTELNKLRKTVGLEQKEASITTRGNAEEINKKYDLSQKENKNVTEPEPQPKLEEPPVEPPKETEVAAQDDVTGITHAANGVRRQQQRLPEYQRNPETFEKWNNEAEQKLKEGYNIDELFDRVESDQNFRVTPVENAIRKIHMASLDAEIRKNPTDELLAKQRRAIVVGDIINSRAGKDLASLKGEGNPLETISDFYVAKMEVNGVDKLTDAQKEQVQKRFENLEKRNKELEEKSAEYEAKYNDMLAQKEIDKHHSEVRKSPAVKVKKNHNDYVKERVSLKEKLKQQKEEHEQWLKDNGIQKQGFGFTLTTDMAKTIMDIVKSHADEIGNNLAEVVAKTLNEVKDIFDGVDEKDIRDVIAGVYNEKKKTKTQLAIDLRDLRDEQKLLNQYEALLKGEEPKSEKQKVERNQKIKDLRNKIKEEPDPKKLTAIKKRNEAQTKKILDKIAKGDFEKEERKPILEDKELQKKYPKLYKEVLDGIVAREDARHQFDIDLMKDELAKRSTFKKGIELGSSLFATAKAIVSGIDDSALFIQNIVAMAAHPKSAAKAIPEHILDAFSEKRFNRQLAALHNSKAWDLIQKSGLDVTEPKSLKAEKKEEVFDSNLLNKTIRIKGKEFKIGTYTTAPFERAFTSLGNNFRVDAFLRLADKLHKEGYSFESHPEKFKDLATMLNTETGRGKLPDQIQRASQLITAGIWSPRLIASRLNILGFGDLGSVLRGKKGYYASLDPRIQAMAIDDTAQFIMTGAAIMGVASMMGAEIDTDPRSPTFGGIKIGDTWRNIWGGFSQYVRLITQLLTGTVVKGGKEEEANRGKQLWKFVRGKFTPAAGAVTDVALQSDYFGAPIDYTDEALGLVTPLSAKDVTKQIERDGYMSILDQGIPSFVGINQSDERDYQHKDQEKKPTLSHTGSHTSGRNLNHSR